MEGKYVNELNEAFMRVIIESHFLSNLEDFEIKIEISSGYGIFDTGFFPFPNNECKIAIFHEYKYLDSENMEKIRIEGNKGIW